MELMLIVGLFAAVTLVLLVPAVRGIRR